MLYLFFVYARARPEENKYTTIIISYLWYTYGGKVEFNFFIFSSRNSHGGACSLGGKPWRGGCPSRKALRDRLGTRRLGASVYVYADVVFRFRAPRGTAS